MEDKTLFIQMRFDGESGLEQNFSEMIIRSFFTEESKLTNPYYSYSFLVIIFILIGFQISWLIDLPEDYSGDRFVGFVVPIMLLFNHLAFSFKWNKIGTVFIRIVAVCWLIIGFGYIIHSNHSSTARLEKNRLELEKKRLELQEKEKIAEIEKTKVCSRRIYIKLPLEDVLYHWNFLEKKEFLSGTLSLTIKRSEHSEIFVIFKEGILSPNWSIMKCGTVNPDAMYFGFTSDDPMEVSTLDDVKISLTIKSDIKGIGPDFTGILKKGTYESSGKFKIYFFEKPTKENNEYAFLSNYNLNPQWKLEITSKEGWMKNKENRKN